MELWRANALGVGLFAMLLHIHTQIFRLNRHPERHSACPQHTSDHQGAESCQAIGHQDGLELTANQSKSPLLNRMVGAKVSIVTRKVQTTRARLRGIAVSGESQIVFVDTPGIFAPKRKLMPSFG